MKTAIRPRGYVVRQGEQGGVMTDAGDTLRFVNTRDTGSLEIVKNLDGRTAEFRARV